MNEKVINKSNSNSIDPIEKRVSGLKVILFLLGIWILPWVLLFGLTMILTWNGPLDIPEIIIDSILFGVFCGQFGVTYSIYKAGKRKE